MAVTEGVRFNPRRVNVPRVSGGRISLPLGVKRAGLAVAIVVAACILALTFTTTGEDWVIYRGAALRWLGGGSYFLDSQLHGPYQLIMGDVLYPPAALAVFVPFAWLPVALWRLGPLVIAGLALAKLRPAPWAWLIVGYLWFWSGSLYWDHANPVMWSMAVLFGWAAWDWPAAPLLLQPSMLPFALLGVRRRSWWIVAAVVALLSLATLPLTITWFRVIAQMESGRGIFYGAREWFVCAIPVVAYLGSDLGPLKSLRLNVWRRREVETQPTTG